MSGKTYAHCDTVLGILKGTAVTTLTNLYCAILKTSPSIDDMTGAVETNYTNYVRLTMGTISSAWSSITTSAPNRVMSNANLLTFATAGATGDTVNGFALSKTAATAITTAGEAVYWGALTGAPKTINSSDPVSIAIGALTVTED